MIRIIIEIDGKEVSSTTVPPTSGLAAASPELLARAATLGAMDAGSAPSGLAGLAAAVAAPTAIDAGASREDATSGEPAPTPPRRDG
jgi:hypothetical protein